jgi:hypothetical protein
LVGAGLAGFKRSAVRQIRAAAPRCRQAGNRRRQDRYVGGQWRQQIVHVVLVGFGMVGAANVDAERLAAEMVLEHGADESFLPSWRYSGPMKPTTPLTSNGSNARAAAQARASQVC